MRNKCLLSLGLVFAITTASIVAFAFSFVGTPSDEIDARKIITQAAVFEEADVILTTTPVATTGAVPKAERAEKSKIGSMDWDSSDAYMLAKIAMAEAESEDTEGKALVMLVVLNRVWSDEFPDTIKGVILQEGQFSPISNGIPIMGNVLFVGEEWTSDGIDFCGIEDETFKLLELELNNMVYAMKATKEALSR